MYFGKVCIFYIFEVKYWIFTFFLLSSYLMNLVKTSAVFDSSQFNDIFQVFKKDLISVFHLPYNMTS